MGLNPTNVGHSKRNFTRASRTILWLFGKDNPKIYIDRVLQPYKNLNDKRIKENIAKWSQRNTHLYDWWITTNLVKNVSKQKHNYTNQIPQEFIAKKIS